MSDDKLPKICTSGSTRAGNMAIGIVNSFGGIFGFHHKSPLEKLKQDISEAQAETQTVINKGVESFATLQGEFDSQMLRDIMLVNSNLHSFIKIHDEILSEDIITNKVYIFGSYILLLVVILALYFTKSFLR